MPEFKVIVTDDRFGSYTEEKTILAEVDAELTVHNCRTDEELLAAAADADAILVNLYPMTRQIIEKLPRCRIISRYGVGYDNVNVRAATEAGIWVAYVPDYSLEEVSDHVLGLLLGLIRRTTYVHNRVTNGNWNLQNEIPVPRTAGRTMGIIGYGRTGKVLHRKISGFNFNRVLICDPYLDADLIKSGGGIPVDLETLLKEADFISIHTCLNWTTRHLFGARELALMKNTAILINTARGSIIDETALCAALKEKRIAAAGLDVYEQEPLPADSELRSLENVLLTSHMAYYSTESVVELKTKAARNVLTVLKGGKPIYPVNDILLTINS